MSRVPEDRPRWVDDAARELTQTSAALEAARARIAELALMLRAIHVATDELTEAHHDLEHAGEHLASTRRALLMTWPGLTDDDEPPSAAAMQERLLAIAPRIVLGSYHPGLERIARRGGSTLVALAARAVRVLRTRQRR